MTREELERDYEHVGDPSQAISAVKRLIAAGRGQEHVRFVLSRDEPGSQVLEGSAVEVFPELVEVGRKWITAAIKETAEKMETAKFALSAENRALVADRDPITPQNEAQIQLWVSKVARSAAEARAKLLENQPEFDEELKALNAQIAELTSMTHERADHSAGAGKVRVLDERRLARDENQIRHPPLRDEIIRREQQFQQVNQDARDLIKHITGKPLVRAIEEILDQSFPELMKAFYPRVYAHTGRYHSPRQCAAMIANVVAEMLRYGFGRSATAYRLLMPGLTYLRERRMPMFFLAPDLLEAVLRTDFDDDINWTQLELPYETGILILPKGSLVHPEDGDVSMLIWSRVAKGDHPPPWLGLPSQTLADNSFIILGACPEKMIWYDSILTANARPTMRLNNLFYRDPGQPMPSVTKGSVLDADLTEKDSEFVEKMGVVVFGTILAMNARPLLVEHGKLIKRVGKGEKSREFWTPNVIGAKYKIKREVPRVVAGKFVYASREGGTHASPRMHWRRGHHRQQPVGPGRKQRKSIWIEPCLIGAE